MSLAPGTRLGPYEVIAALSAGGMGEVYRARDTRLSRDVAIKALPAEFARDPERLARFDREAKLLASLSHPNIAGIHGLEVVDGAPYLVLEFVDGETLASRLARGPLPVDEALHVARQIAAGLEAAHENGVIHRDLKPGNVILTASGSVKVLDFGLARSGKTTGAGSELNLSNSPTMTRGATQAGMILGTAAYMSPEQARGRSVDKRSDIWSFGCVLYECVVGRPLFEGETVSDLIARILQVEPDWSALPAAVPARVRQLLRRCLSRDVAERLRDIGEARIALGAPAEVERPVGPSAARGVPWLVTALVALVAATGAVFATLQLGRPNRPGVVRKFDMIASNLSNDWRSAPQLSPDGSRFAYTSEQQVWVRDLDHLLPRAVAEILEPTSVAWSPDSREILYGDSRKLWKVSAAGGRPIAICEIPATGNIIGATWSASGTIAFSVWRDRMYKVPASGGNPTPMIDIDPATQIDFHAPSWLPGGELLYLTHWRHGLSRRLDRHLEKKGEPDSTGEMRHHLMIFDGKRQIGIAGHLASEDDMPILTSTGDLLFLRGGATPGIWTVAFDQRQRRFAGTPVLVAPDALTVSASSDGSLLYLEGSRTNPPRELVWVDRGGARIENVGRPHPELSSPRLSPDGSRVAFTATDDGNEDVWVLNLETGVETRLTFSSKSELAPEWLGSSSRLTYVEREGISGRIMSINADGSGAERPFAPTTQGGWGVGNVELAPDGRSAIRVVDERGHGSLRIGELLPDGTLGPLRRVMAQVPEPNVSEARISPDGRLLAYQTNDPGRIDVFLTRFPEGAGKWQVGTDWGRHPRWARDTNELFLVAGGGLSRRDVIAVTVNSSQDPPLASLKRLFSSDSPEDLGDFDVAADGQRLLFARSTESGGGAARHLVLVQNWRSGIERGERR